jgi:hypothetical protein
VPKFKAHFTTTASATVEVEIPQETIDENGLDIAITDLVESGLIDMPDVCARCGGWRQTYSLELAGEWDTNEVTDEQGNTVWGGHEAEGN